MGMFCKTLLVFHLKYYMGSRFRMFTCELAGRSAISDYDLSKWQVCLILSPVQHQIVLDTSLPQNCFS